MGNALSKKYEYVEVEDQEIMTVLYNKKQPIEIVSRPKLLRDLSPNESLVFAGVQKFLLDLPTLTLVGKCRNKTSVPCVIKQIPSKENLVFFGDRFYLGNSCYGIEIRIYNNNMLVSNDITFFVEVELFSGEKLNGKSIGTAYMAIK